MITVYGADWCEDTRRTLRHLRRLGIPHHYRNIDEDSRALRRARELNPTDVERRTPVVDLALGGPPLVEPDNDTLTEALVEREMLTTEDAAERLAVQNVGDLDRLVRTAAGVLLLGAAAAAPGRAKSVFRIAGGVVALSGLSGWCPAYQVAGLTSIGGVGDRPLETTRTTWFDGSVRGKARDSRDVASGEELR
jgi:glutaredoxin